MSNMCSLALCAGLVWAPFTAAAQTLPPPDQQKLARQILQELIEINTTEANGSTPAAEVLAARFRAAGFADADVLLVGPNPRHLNLVVRYHGSAKTAARPILFIAHLNVVEARREDWSMDPFTLTEKDGYFYGRGTSDIKDEVADLASNFIRLKREGFAPARDMILAFTDDEEGGEFNGAKWLVANRRDLVDVAYVINVDAAGGQLKDGKHLRNPVQTSEKLYVTYTMEVVNPGGHSSMPVPDNAIYRLARGLERLSRFEFPARLNETTRAYFKAIAGQEPGQVGADLAAIARGKPDPRAVARLGASPFYHAMMRNTCVATMLQAGHAENALPQRAQATIQCRLLPGEEPDSVRRTLRRVVSDTQIAVTMANVPNPSPASPVDPEIMEPVRRITTEMWPGAVVLPVMDPWSTDGLHFRRAGIPVYGVSAVFIDVDDSRAHGRDERVGVTEFYEGVEFMYRLIRSLAGPSPPPSPSAG